MTPTPQIPPRHGEGDHAQRGGGGARSARAPTGAPTPRAGGADFARKLRRELSLPEGLLWRELRTRPAGLKFRRQTAAGSYVLDFYCAEARLVIEIDGSGHDCADRADRDSARDCWFADHGIATLRLSARDVLADLPAALDTIVAAALARRPLHRPAARSGPPPRAGEEQHASAPQMPPRQGEGDHAQHGGGGAPQARAYEVEIFPLSAADGGGFAAIAPELPGCRSDGDTPEEALANAYDAIACWIGAAVEMGREVPQPRRVAA